MYLYMYVNLSLSLYIYIYIVYRVSTEVTFGRGDLSVCPLGGLIGAQECLVSHWRVSPRGPHEDKD